MKFKVVSIILVLMVFIAPNFVFGAIEMEPVWVFSSQGDLEANSWVPESISLGNHSSEIFSTLGTSPNPNRVFSVHDDITPPNALWSIFQDGNSFGKKSGAAQNTDSYATMRFESPQLSGYKDIVINKYTNGEEDFEYTFPFQRYEWGNYDHGVAVSDDGDKVTGWAWNPSETDTVIVTFDGNSNNPVLYKSLHTGGEPRFVGTSSDGGLLYLVSTLKTFVIDLESGNIIYQHTNWSSVSVGGDFSADGKVFAQEVGTGVIRAHRWNDQTQTYTQIFEEQIVSGTPFYCWDGRALSADGNILAVACYNTNNLLDIEIRIFDLTNNSGNLLLSDSVQGGGQYNNLPTYVSVSRDGTVVAIGTSGDEDFESPILRVYTKGTNGWSLYGTYNHDDSLGSAQTVEVNAIDGVGTVMLGSKATHDNIFASGGTIKVFNIGNGLTLKGTPIQNQTSNFNFRANAGSVIISEGLATTPVYIPGVGYFYLDSGANMTVLPPESADSRGVVDVEYGFSQNPGTELYAQALMFGSNGSRSFSKNYLKMKVEGQSGVPFPPTNVEASDGFENVEVTWTHSTTQNIDHYDVYRDRHSLELIGQTPDDHFTDDTANFGEVYQYKIKSVNSNGSSIFSNYDLGYRLEVPQNVSASDGNEGSITVNWDSSEGASKYKVFKNTNRNSCEGEFVEVQTNSYIDTNVNVGTRYYYSVLPAFQQSDGTILEGAVCSNVDSGHAIGETANCNYPGAIPNANGTCTAKIPVSTYDGNLGEGDSQWPDAREALQSEYVNDQGMFLGVETREHPEINYFSITRSFQPVDTSDLPDSANILEASLNFYPAYITGTPILNLYESNQGNPTDLEQNDYPRCSSGINPSDSEKLGTISPNTNQVNTWLSIDINDLSVVSKTGWTTLCIRENADSANIPPTIDEYRRVWFPSSNSSNVDQRPYLEVTYDL